MANSSLIYLCIFILWPLENVILLILYKNWFHFFFILKCCVYVLLKTGKWNENFHFWKKAGKFAKTLKNVKMFNEPCHHFFKHTHDVSISSIPPEITTNIWQNFYESLSSFKWSNFSCHFQMKKTTAKQNRMIRLWIFHYYFFLCYLRCHRIL